MRKQSGNRTILKEFSRIMVLIFFIAGVVFLCLLQRVRARDLDQEIRHLKKERARLVKRINKLDFRLEQLKRPERIIPLAKKLLGMEERTKQ